MMKILKKANAVEISFFLGLLIISLFLTFNTHRKNDFFTWKSEIWADRAGYYIYLPSFFMYHFDAKKCPEKIDEKTGYGFNIDYQKNTINTKYTYGIAALLSPFFIGARIASPVLKLPGDAGFGPVYHRMVNVAAVVYLILGLCLLKRFLGFYFKPSLQYLILFFIYAGTNLLFYTIDDTLMSHVYSFFLFSLFLLFMKKFIEDTSRYRYFLVMTLTYALIFLIRPTNALILVLFFTWDTDGIKEIRQRISVFFTYRNLLSFVVIVICIFLPQIIYWKYSRGNFLAYSYSGESFSNWNHPKLPEVWFSTLNGLFLYAPMVILMIAGMIIMIIKKIPDGLLTLILFFLISYIFASWYNWYFGCSFGQRSFVEYYAIFAIPFGYFIRDSMQIRNLLLRALVLLPLLLFSYYNVRMTLNFNKCFFGSTWDWEQFGRQLNKAGLVPANTRPYRFINDLENDAISYDYTRSDSVKRSGMYSGKLSIEREFCLVFFKTFWDFSATSPKTIETSCLIYNPRSNPTGALVVCSIEKDSVVNWQSQELDSDASKPGHWFKVSGKFIIPENLSMDHKVKIIIWNRRKSTFFVDDLDVKIK
jgi:hypothetical protein